jgi:glucokinase
MASPSKPFVGVDLGGTNMQIGVVSPEYKILAPAKRKTKAAEGLEAVVTRIVSGIEEACHTAGIAVANLGGVGIGAPGAVDPDEGVVIEAVNLRWKDTPLADILSKRLKTKVYLDNDVNVAVFGEWKLGAGRGCDDLLGVWVGTGIGGGLILNGKLYYGHFKTCGEIGHTILFPNNPKGHRSLEHNCSRTAVVEQLVRLIKGNHKSKLAGELEDDVEKIKSRTLARHYHGGEREDSLVIEVIDRSADDLAFAIANTVTLLSLPRVVLGGGLTEACGKPFVERVQRSARELVFPPALRKLEVVASQLEDNAGVLGAAMIAMDRASRDRR